MKTKFKYLIGIFLIAFIINVFGFTKNVYAEEASYKEFTKNAINASNEMDLYTSVMLAQYFLESGAKVEGDSITLSKLGASPYHNLFGIKGEYEGQSVSM
ncbi:glucosaminidase domain-containing protein, partial [Sutterella wadsworthensis]|uniref:glucosaminidase domain-containing protein n=1 Tax=Sutterella wadsworthensis TaxID=40545 RepID=UPI0032C07140